MMDAKTARFSKQFAGAFPLQKQASRTTINVSLVQRIFRARG